MFPAIRFPLSMPVSPPLSFLLKSTHLSSENFTLNHTLLFQNVNIGINTPKKQRKIKQKHML